jgi:hypothetical protein
VLSELGEQLFCGSVLPGECGWPRLCASDADSLSCESWVSSVMADHPTPVNGETRTVLSSPRCSHVTVATPDGHA